MQAFGQAANLIIKSKAIMYRLSNKSIEKMRGCEPEIVVLMATAIIDSPVDFSIVSGFRTVREQEKLYAQGRTEPGEIVTQKDGRVNLSDHQLGEAVDICVWRGRLVWVDAEGYKQIREHIEKVAERIGIKLRKRILWDMGHYEVIK